MTQRPDGLRTGPQDPVRETPPRRPGSVRRTTCLEQRRGGPGESQRIVGSGRDLLTRPDGSTQVLDLATLDLDVAPDGTVGAVATAPEVPALAGLVGGAVRKGLRPRVDQLVPDLRDAATVLHQLLDDLPMAALISSYGSTREAPDFKLPAEAADRLTDLCAGWAAGGTMLVTLGRSGIFPIPVGPDAPVLERADDPLSWQELPEMAPRSVRRRRRLDVALVDGVLEVDAHFRDSHLGLDGPEDVLHEYALAATVDPADLTVLSSVATARVLPWPECPGSLASAGRAVGLRVADLRATVTTDFTGTTTCTHLNDTLRSLAGLVSLAPALPPPGD